MSEASSRTDRPGERELADAVRQLAREVQDLRRTVQEQDAVIRGLRAAPPPGHPGVVPLAVGDPVPTAGQRVLDRRGLLKAVPAAGAGAVGASLLGTPAAAAAEPAVVTADEVRAKRLVVADSRYSSLPPPHDFVQESTKGSFEVTPLGQACVTIKGPYSVSGREGTDSGGVGLQVETWGNAGIVSNTVESPGGQRPPAPSTAFRGTASSDQTWYGPGAVFDGTASGTAVGLRLSTHSGAVIDAHSTGTMAGDAFVLTAAGLGRVVHARATNPKNGVGAVTGVSAGSGAGVWGHQENPESTEGAVVGWSTGTKGRGGRFRGGAAQIALVPGLAANHPTSGQAGDLYVDSTKRLWFCKGGASWVQLG